MPSSRNSLTAMNNRITDHGDQLADIRTGMDDIRTNLRTSMDDLRTLIAGLVLGTTNPAPSYATMTARPNTPSSKEPKDPTSSLSRLGQTRGSTRPTNSRTTTSPPDDEPPVLTLDLSANVTRRTSTGHAVSRPPPPSDSENDDHTGHGVEEHKSITSSLRSHHDDKEDPFTTKSITTSSSLPSRSTRLKLNELSLPDLDAEIAHVLGSYPKGTMDHVLDYLGHRRTRALSRNMEDAADASAANAKAIPAKAPLQRFNQHGTPLSARGYPRVPWYKPKDDLNAEDYIPPSGPRKPPYKSSNRRHSANPDDPGDPDDDYGNADDADEDDCRSQRSRLSQRRDKSNHGRFSNTVTENTRRRRVKSVSRYYPRIPDDPGSNLVAWNKNSIDGPYAGKPDRVAKYTFELQSDLAGDFFIFYNTLRSFFNSCGYHPELLPELRYIRVDLDLTRTPIDRDMPPIGSKDGGELMPRLYWQEQHDSLSITLFAMLNSKNVISKTAIRSRRILDFSQFQGDGFKVLQDIMCLHHPGHKLSQAPDYHNVRNTAPVMKASVQPVDLLDALTTYYMTFSNWESHLMLYPQASYIRGSVLHLLFITGLTPTLRTQVTNEHLDLQVFHQAHKQDSPEPPADSRLHAKAIYDRLSAGARPLSRITTLPPTAGKSQVSAIQLEMPDLQGILETVAPPPEEIVAMCSQIGDSALVEDVVAAFQRNHNRRQSQSEKRPSALCRHLTCSKHHSPDDCCVCSNQRHPIEKCWHIVGLPSNKQSLVDLFQQQHLGSTGPWTPSATVHGVHFEPHVALVAPDKPLMTPSLSKSGTVLSEEEGDLHDVKEMDHSFKSSFILHHLASQPNVSAIPADKEPFPQHVANLPTDGPAVVFASKGDTVLAHVDTGATVMVSNVPGELHGAIPTKAHCGTAMTGSKATIDALGTWMVELVGANGDDLPLALRGTTQITEFQRRSLSLHALKELGFDCAHIISQQGNFLEIHSGGMKHIFPLLTINGGDYVEMRVIQPPPPNVATINVARLDLVKNFPVDGLYHLLHLRYGCPGRRQMELILNAEHTQGVPANVSIPSIFRCPICDKEKTNSLPRNEISDRTFLPIGVRFHADFGFYKKQSVRGFHCFLLISEAVTGYKWAFCRRSKHPPINLLLWFIRQLRSRLGVTFAILRTDGGGELWGCHALRSRLLDESQCIMEPTGAYNSAANGIAERGIGVLCIQTQICLFASGMDVSYWCFAMSHAAMLCNFRPQVDTKVSSHEALFKKKPNYSNLAIWGSPVYVVDRRLTRRRPESATVTGRFLGYAGSHHIITYLNDMTGAIQYAHHTAIDELDLQRLPGDRSPAAKFLSGIVPDARHELELRQEIADLTPTLTPWLTDQLVYHHIPYDVTCTVLGVVTETDRHYDRLRLISLTPGSPAERHLGNKNVIGYYILSINGVRVRSVSDLRLVLHDYHSPSDERGPSYLTGVTILFGIASPNEVEPQQIEFSEQDHATARVVWSIIASEYFKTAPVSSFTIGQLDAEHDPGEHPTSPPPTTRSFHGGGTDSKAALRELQHALLPPPDDDTIDYLKSIIISALHLKNDLPDDEILAFVASIMASDLNPVCPKFWHQAMKDPVQKGKWIEAMFKHLDSCYSIGTFGPPRIPPSNVTILPAVIVLKMIVNAVKQINAHKVRVCVHGGHQEQGRDYDESFAHTVLGRSIKICVAISCYLLWFIFHFDIHNAFQTCPDDSPEAERTWLRINQTWLDYFRERRPNDWPAVQALLDKGFRPEQFAVEMFMFVQGRTDASRKWGEMVDEFIFTVLGLLPNRADPCTYSGIFNGCPVILCRATDDFLLFCKDQSTYDAMIVAFRNKWTVHALDQVKMFFGIRFILSDRCVTLDQTHKVNDIIKEVFGRNHHKQEAGRGFATPMIAGTAFANELAACTPYSPAELQTAQRTTYGFVFRHILGGCMHCALWTRLDILTACLTLAQYQAQPGDLHFKALKHIVGYLRLHPDLPLTFQRSTVNKDVASINFELLEPDLISQVNALNIEIIPSNFNVPVNSDPTAFTSCDNLFQTFGDTLQDADRPSSFSPAIVSRIAPPVTECLVDANLPGGLYERMATTGGSIEMGGTTVVHVCKKQDTMAENSTEAEIDAAAFLGKILRWLVLFMSDLGLPFQSPIPIAEDNSATRIIAHSGKVTRNVRHVAIKTLALQGLVRNKIAIFNAIGTAYNRADHFTKPLALIAFRDHITMMMGLRFLTKLHAALTAERNREDFSGE